MPLSNHYLPPLEFQLLFETDSQSCRELNLLVFDNHVGDHFLVVFQQQ